MINEPPKPQTDSDRVKILRDAAGEAFEYLECYCNCGSRNIVAKKLRIALQCTEPLKPDATKHPTQPVPSHGEAKP